MKTFTDNNIKCLIFRKGWARGEERNADNHRKRSPIKNVYSRSIIFFSRADTVGPSVKKFNKRFVHSFIHSFIYFPCILGAYNKLVQTLWKHSLGICILPQ